MSTSPVTCKQCGFPLNHLCACEECEGSKYFASYCHVCTVMHRVLFRSAYFVKVQEDWKREDDDRRRRMGL